MEDLASPRSDPGEVKQRQNIDIQPKFLAELDDQIYTRLRAELDSSFQITVDVSNDHSIRFRLLRGYLHKLLPGEDSVMVDIIITDTEIEVAAEFRSDLLTGSSTTRLQRAAYTVTPLHPTMTPHMSA